MKRETLRHPKTLDLAARIGADRPTALGYLMLLWDFTAEYAIQGDVGKWTNEVIARACDYRADHDSFVEALTHAKWLDKDTTHRLVIHDWPHHCERWVKLKMGKLGISFLSCYGSVEASIEPPIEGSAYVTEPIQSNPIQIPTGRWAGREKADGMKTIVVDARLWDECVPLMTRIKAVLAPDRALKPDDRELCCKAAVIALRLFDEQWLDDTLHGIKRKREPLLTPWGYFKSSLAKSAARLGDDFHKALDMVEVPARFLERPKAPA